MAQRAPFPSNPDEFSADHRISYSKESKTFLLEDENGEEWEWLSGPSKWSKTMDEALMKQQQEIYKIAGVDDEAPALDPVKKRKAAQQDDLDTNKKAKATNGASATATATALPATSKLNDTTAVFVSGLPLDVNVDEIRDNFIKCGMIAESADDNEKRIKLYNDAEGNFKGEALIVFFRAESAQMAVDYFNDTVFLRDFGLPTSTITVQKADPSYKKSKDDADAEDRSSTMKAKPSKAKIKRKAEEMNSKLADWSSDDDVSTVRQTSSRYNKVVVLKHVFTLEEVATEKDFLQDTMEDMEQGANDHGEVKNITIFDLEPDGVVTFRYDNAESAKKCVTAMNGRWYGGRQLEASLFTGEHFKKTRKNAEEKEAEEAKRLEQFSKDIEA